MSTMPDVGAAAPDFTGTTGEGETVSLSEYRGRWVLLYFYPRDNTPGCTRQACNLRDHFEALEQAGVAVLGVSSDSEASHARFAEKHGLPFPLVADPDREILERYGVWGERNFYGKKVTGTKRTTFLIDPEGTVRWVFKRPKTGQHAEEVLAKRAELMGA
ncbi:MAG: thioredoxin-dependent thiol peroxidase [Rhodothermales bacterium]|nr:thioredoxin-dependent thiol peroxidase [Rhodothermales bacterium]